MNSSADDRVAPRVEKDVTIFIELTSVTTDNEGQSDIVICKSVNLSSTGVQVVLDRAIPKGRILRLCLDTKDRSPIFVMAQAMWQQEDAKTHEQYVGFKLLDSLGTDFADWRVAVAEMFDI